MDQVRTALLWLKRHHFWVLCGLVVLVSLFSWAKASSKLSALFAANQSAIQGQFTKVKGVRNEPFHPNEDVNSKQEAQTTQQAAAVAKLWQQLYDRQREHVLEWPPELNQDFRDYVEKLQFGDEIRPDLRNHYQNYIENHFLALPKAIEARPADPNVAPGGPGGGEFGRSMSFSEMPGDGTEMLDDGNYITEWSPADQARIREELNFRERPSSLKIWVTQENLWVYHTLLDVIAKTNKAAKATRISNAAVQQVGELAVGPQAGVGSRTSGRLWIQPAEAVALLGPPGVGPEGGESPAAPAEGPGIGGPGSPSEFGPGGPGMGGGPMTPEQEKAFLLTNRYLDANGKPIPFGGAGAAALSPDGSPPAAPDPAAASQPLDLSVFGTEYKRLPVRMALRMNQRWLPQLIAECASQPLQIEVQEVRINPPEGIASAGGPGGGGPGGRPGDGMGGNASVFAEEPPFQPFPTDTEMVNVILQGTVYIFNKPNPAVLQTPGGAGGEQAPPPTTAAAQ